MIIFPAIDIRDNKCVRLSQGNYDKETVYFDDPFRVDVYKRQDIGLFNQFICINSSRYRTL